LIGKKVVQKKSEMEYSNKKIPMTVLFKELPEIVQEYETFKSAVLSGEKVGEIPNVEFRLLTALNLTSKQWTKIAEDMPWHATRMNLNTFSRHSVYDNAATVTTIAEKLRNREIIKKSKVFPYQILTTYKNIEGVPNKIVDALQDALEISTENVPEFNCEGITVLVDTSGSMGSSVTGSRGSATSKTTNMDVAALFASCIVRQNKNADVILFDTSASYASFNPRDTILTNAKKFSRGGGGTDCSAGLRLLNQKGHKGDLVVMVSDNESWHQLAGTRYHSGTTAQAEWQTYKKRNPKAKLVCIDISPNSSSQVKEAKDVLNVGGFSDDVFTIIRDFVSGELEGETLVKTIEGIEINPVVDLVKKGAVKAVKLSKKK
jgi:60 kDa SS-A/Ro ribonucleoprotein